MSRGKKRANASKNARGARSITARSLGVLGLVGFTNVLIAGPASAVKSPAKYSPLTTQISAEPGETVQLPDYAWVAQQLSNPNLTPAARQYLDELPVWGQNAGPIANTPSAPAGDPIASEICNAKDMFGVTVATYSSYVGFSVGTPKGATQQEITQMSVPNDYFSSGLYALDGQSTWETSQPGPPTPYMSGQDGVAATLVGALYPLTITIDYNFYGSGVWNASCLF